LQSRTLTTTTTTVGSRHDPRADYHGRVRRLSRRPYAPHQQAALDLLAAAHLAKVKAKATLRATIEAQLASALNDLAVKESEQANRALIVGVKKADIGRAIGTTNWDTLQAVLARVQMPNQYAPSTVVRHVK
jgi:hypothetical protein